MWVFKTKQSRLHIGPGDSQVFKGSINLEFSVRVKRGIGDDFSRPEGLGPTRIFANSYLKDPQE